MAITFIRHHPVGLIPSGEVTCASVTDVTLIRMWNIATAIANMIHQLTNIHENSRHVFLLI